MLFLLTISTLHNTSLVLLSKKNNNGEYVIMDNDKLVGKNYLTFINIMEHGSIHEYHLLEINSQSIQKFIALHLPANLSLLDNQEAF